MVREFIKLLYGDICQTCFVHKDCTPLCSVDWSHYISRRYLIVRFDMRNSLPQCRKCHQQYTDGFNGPMIQAINRIWGKGTTNKLEKIASQYPSIKGSYLDKVEFRLELETYYKKLIQALKSGMSHEDITKNVFTSDGWGRRWEKDE